MIMVEVGGRFTKTSPLNTKQNLICLAIGFLELPVGLFIKFLPIGWFQCIKINDELPPDSDDEDEEGKEKVKKP